MPAPSHHPDDAPVDLRCSVAVIRDDHFLLIHRTKTDDWVLPGGTPRRGESMTSCARRETREETGLAVTPNRCAFVLEVGGDGQTRRVELVFTAELRENGDLIAGEDGTTPQWTHLDQLPALRLRPPLAGYLPALVRGNRGTAAYLGNMWRPEESAQWD
jgi:8-oxo-dGTP diphosphatase